MSVTPTEPNPSIDLDRARRAGSTTSANSPVIDVHTATVAGDRAAVRLQLARGVEPGAMSADGWAPLHLAASTGDVRMAELLIAAGAPVDQRSGGACCAGAAPIHCAVASGNAEIVDLLLRTGARRDPRDEAGYTPLLLAAERGDLRIVRALLKAGADRRATVGEWSALGLARRARHHQVFALLKQVGVT
ncbi:MAG: ankyrin repeat domain-containing protein [Myxococcota bacterium]